MSIQYDYLNDEKPKYKKKSTAKGQPRSKHKHTYETVLLRCYHTYPDFKTGRPKTSFTELPTKVCTVCGRIDYVDRDPSLYTHKKIEHIPFQAYSKELSEKALTLPKYYKNDFLDKIAKEGEGPDNV